nr:hypothetical protein [Tanacetum cinerariifolium]
MDVPESVWEQTRSGPPFNNDVEQ